ncbi:MAG: hypothetical protein MI919_41790, partial [Holophagales bacterium]|nr:hypothetical protein [Holophagales bacterium]
HHLRQALARVLGKPVDRLDPILRDPHLDAAKRQAWIEDQYRHPLEQDLPLPRVAREIESAGLRWVRTVPPAPPSRGLFTHSRRPDGLSLGLLRLGWALRGLHEPDAGLVSIVARRPG